MFVKSIILLIIILFMFVVIQYNKDYKKRRFMFAFLNNENQTMISINKRIYIFKMYCLYVHETVVKSSLS